MEQRNGRIIRQGNKSGEVYIFRYVIENTYDACPYRIIEKKQRFISQIMTGKSPVIGRLRLYVHVTAGFGDVGFSGYWTLEIQCIQPVRIYTGVKICQIYYNSIEGDYVKYYSGKYQNNTGLQPSLLYKNFEQGD